MMRKRDTSVDIRNDGTLQPCQVVRPLSNDCAVLRVIGFKPQSEGLASGVREPIVTDRQALVQECQVRQLRRSRQRRGGTL